MVFLLSGGGIFWVAVDTSRRVVSFAVLRPRREDGSDVRPVLGGGGCGIGRDLFFNSGRGGGWVSDASSSEREGGGELAVADRFLGSSGSVGLSGAIGWDIVVSGSGICPGEDGALDSVEEVPLASSRGLKHCWVDGEGEGPRTWGPSPDGSLDGWYLMAMPPRANNSRSGTPRHGFAQSKEVTSSG